MRTKTENITLVLSAFEKELIVGLAKDNEQRPSVFARDRLLETLRISFECKPLPQEKREQYALLGEWQELLEEGRIEEAIVEIKQYRQRLMARS